MMYMSEVCTFADNCAHLTHIKENMSNVMIHGADNQPSNFDTCR